MGTAAVALAFVTAIYCFPLFYTAAEMFAVIVAASVFLTAWNSRRFSRDNYLLTIGVSFLFVAGIDALHMLLSAPLAILPHADRNMSMQLWHAGRLLQAFAFVAAPFMIQRKTRPAGIYLATAGATALLLALILTNALPPLTLHPEGASGPTAFQYALSLAVAVLFLGSIGPLWLSKREFPTHTLIYLTVYAILMAMAQGIFSAAARPAGVAELTAYLLKIGAFYVIYIAFVQTGLFRPVNLPFADLRRHKSLLRDAILESTRKKAEKEALLEGAHLVLEHNDFRRTAESIFRTCKRLVGAEAGYVAILGKDGDGGEIIHVDIGDAACGVTDKNAMPFKNIGQRILEASGPRIINDLTPNEWAERLPKGHIGIKNALTVPLTKDGKPVGLLNLANKAGGFSKNDADLALAFAKLASIALRNTRVRQHLQESELRYRTLTQTAVDAIISADASGKIVSWNQGARSIFGWDEQEILGKPLTALMPAEYAVAHNSALEALSNGAKPRLIGRTICLWGVRKDSSRFPIELSLSTWMTGQGRFYTGIVRDISDRLEVEQALKKSEEKFRTLVAHVPGAVYRASWDDGREMEFISSVIETISGFPAPDFIGSTVRSYRSIVHPADYENIMVKVKAAVESGAPYDIEYRIIHRDGSTRWVRDQGKAQHDDAGGLCLDGTIFDVTKQRLAEDALQESNRLLEQELDERGAELLRSNRALLRQIEERKRLERQVIRASEQEQQRIGQQLYDGLGQELAGMAFMLRTLQKKMDVDSPLNQEIDQVLTLVHKAINEVRGVSKGLYPAEIRSGGLRTALGELADNTRKLFGIDCSFASDAEIEIFDPAVATHVYRIAQEAAAHAVKHARAGKISMALKKCDNNAILVVENDGTHAPAEGTDLQTISYRADVIDGMLQVCAGSQGGTRLICRFPNIKK